MTSYEKRPTGVSQTTTVGWADGKYVLFKNLERMIDEDENSYAITKTQIGGKSTEYNRPSYLRFSNFNFNIPEYENVTNVQLQMTHAQFQELGVTTGDCCNITSSNVILLPNADIPVSGKLGRPDIYTRDFSTATTDFNMETYSLNNSIFNSPQFGFEVIYPRNANKNWGYLAIADVKIIINTIKSEYSFEVDKNSIQDAIVDEYVDIKFKVNNENGTKYNPQLLINLPTYTENGVPKEYLEYVSKVSGNGEISQGETGNLYWNAGLNDGAEEKSCVLRFKCLKRGEELSVTLNENKYGLTIDQGSYDLEILDPPMTVTYEKLPQFLVQGQDLTIELNAKVPTCLTSEKSCIIDFFNCDYTDIDIDNENVEIDNTQLIWTPSLLENTNEKLVFTLNNLSNGDYGNSINISIETEDEGNLLKQDILIIPQNTGKPFYTCLQLSEEELNRMGKGYSYIVGCLMRVNNESDETLQDYGTNFRIGVYHEDPSIILFDECSSNKLRSSYVSSHVSINYENEHKIIEHNGGYEGTYLYDHDFDEDDVLSFEFIVHENINTNFENVYVVMGDTEYPLSYFNINFNEYEDCKIKLELNYIDETKTTKSISVYKNDKLYCIDDAVLFEDNDKIGFKVQNNDLEVSNIIINELDKSKLYDDLYDKAFENCSKWSKWLVDPDNVNRVTTPPIVYNPKYPVIILFTGEAINMNPEDKELIFSTPFVVENGTSKASTESAPRNGLYPFPIKNIPLGEEVSIDFNNNDTEEIILYNFKNMGSIIGEGRSIVGITLTVDVNSDEDIDVIAFVRPTGFGYEDSGRSIKVTSEELLENNTVTLGGTFDTFGIDFMNDNIEEFEVGIKFSCMKETTISFSNIQIDINYNVLNEDKVFCSVNDTDLRYYGFIITGLKVPFGVDTDTSYLNIGGSDVNKAYRMNIKEKEIEIKFRLEDCDIISSTESMNEIAKIFTNKRDSRNMPIPKRISFSHFPNVYWYFINEEPIDAEAEYVEYEGTIKLKVPDGTSYSTLPQVAVNMGKVGGLARVKPIITLNSLTQEIVVIESKSKQTFRCSSETFYYDDELQINCEDRKLYHYITPENVITNVFFNNEDSKIYTNNNFTQEIPVSQKIPTNLFVVRDGTSDSGTYRYISSEIGYIKISEKMFSENDIHKQIPIECNEFVDWSSDWFILDDEYVFTGVAGDVNTCYVMEVMYYERG